MPGVHVQSLRHKLLVGSGGLLLIMALIGVRGAMQVSDLRGAIQAIMNENYRSVKACQDMKDSLERLDETMLFILLGYSSTGLKEVTQHTVSFEHALRTELNNLTMPGEGERAGHIRDLFARSRSLVDALLFGQHSPEDRNRIYFTELMPLFSQIRGTADEILSMNQENMHQASQLARHKAASARQEMYALLVVGALAALGYVYLMGNWILRPIERLTSSVEDIRQGNLDLVIGSRTRDEIGRLAEAFNEMTAALREARRSDEARMVRLRHSAQQTFNSLPNVVAVADLDGTIEMATETARAIFGLRPGTRIQDVAYPWLRDLFEKTAANAAVPGVKGPAPLIQHFHNAEEHYFRPMTVPILDSSRNTTGVILIVNDVTDQLHQDEMKKGSISTVSHQLKTPLTSVRMALHIMLEEKVGPLTPRQLDLLASASEESDRLNRIIENLLDISRIESGTTALKVHGVNAYQIVHEAVQAFRTAARDKGVELASALPEDLGDVLADTDQIGNVFTNLLSNALRYTSSGGTITISAANNEDSVRFSVSDTGVGIPEQHLPQVFDRFFRIPGQETESGTGLGLAIVKEIVEAHGGTVNVQSAQGSGSTFSFTLPRSDAPKHREDSHG
jgi:signal transduction histidine kinase/HAMP domain-containing protein